MDVKLVSPYLFVVGFITYVITGIVCFSFVSDEFTIHAETFLFIGVGLAFYTLGCQFTLPQKRAVYAVFIAALVVFYSYNEYQIAGLIIPVISIAALLFIQKMKGEWLLSLGILLLVYELIAGGVPLLNPELREANVSLVFIAGHILLFSGVAFVIRKWDIKYAIGLFMGLLGLLSLFTYRVYVMELVIVVFASLLLLKRISMTHLAAAAVPLFGLILFIGYIGVIYQDWRFNPLQLFFFRPAFTFGVLNNIVHEAGLFGITRGELWLNFTSTTVIGPYLFGYDCNITSTIMGPLIFDGGIFELTLMGFFGAALNTMYKKALSNQKYIPYYAVVLAVFLVGIDVSFFPSIIILVFAGLFLVSNPDTLSLKKDGTKTKAVPD